MQRLMQVAGWMLLFAIVALSVVPQPLRPEHASVYFLTGLAFGLGHPSRFVGWLLGLSAFTLAIEIAQIWIPGRHARASDFVVDASAVALGLGVSFVLSRRLTILP